MSKTTKGKDGKAPSNRKTPAKNDEVGYKKPPKSGRFVKGQSGNPRGRPRKPKPQPPRLSDVPSERYLEQEAYRTVTLRENGREIALPMAQAVHRSLLTSAAKGNRLAARDILNRVERAEEEHYRRQLENYLWHAQLKSDGEKSLEIHIKKGEEARKFLIHPEDIFLNSGNGDAYINGPQTPEDLKSYEYTAELRDYCLLLSAYAEKRRKLKSKDEEPVCGYMLLAHCIDSQLRPRFRWKQGEDYSLMQEYLDLTRRQLERKIANEKDRLRMTKPEPQYLTPEMRQGLRRLADKIVKKKAA